MFRSRFKRLQPLHPNAGEGSLKKPFVSPTRTSPVSQPLKEDRTTKQTETAPIPPVVKPKPFSTPFKSPRQTELVKKDEPSADGGKRFCYT